MVFATGVRILCNHTSAIINAFNTIVLAICTSNHRYYEPSCMNTIRTAAYLDCCQLGAGSLGLNNSRCSGSKSFEGFGHHG